MSFFQIMQEVIKLWKLHFHNGVIHHVALKQLQFQNDIWLANLLRVTASCCDCKIKK